MTKQTEKFIKGALILTVAGLVAKILSAIYRIPLGDMIGTEGIGYYDTVYPFYSILVATSLIGVPNAVSKLVAEDIALGEYKKAHKTFKDAMIIILVIGLIVTAAMVFGAGLIIKWQKWEYEYRFILYGLAIAPLFVSVTGAIRGYFQGMQIMKPTAISQVIESAGKMICGLGLVYLLLGRQVDLVIVVSGAAIGASAGIVLSTLYMLITYKRYRAGFKKRIQDDTHPDQVSQYRTIVQKILLLTIPVTIVSAAFSIMNQVDSSMLYGLFQDLGYSKAYVRDIIGNKGLAFTIINVPLTISLALAMSVVPAISQADSLGDIKERNHKIDETIKLGMFFALPASFGVFVLAKPFLDLLYPGLHADANFLRLFAICLIFMIMGQALAAVLQGMGRQFLPLIALGAAIVLKIILNKLLAPIFLDGYGAPISSIGYYMLFVLLDFIYIRKLTGFKPKWIQNLFKPLLSATAMGISVHGIYLLVHQLSGSNAISILVSVFVGALVYGFMIIVLKTLSEEDLAGIPFHGRVISLLKKLRLVKQS